ncbi:ATP-binding protein [Actinosynnema sp. ALI-1.44]|uniref:ATP-binding protein n=1 Tax=Actinosynnema sp. ALI-1.44 TaxID=1933779 RepID=UPI001EDBD9D2|nr:BTAD domain-containing putative transcriptional regulator [Actinosynnema sp. ALI-1.44]
MSELILLPEVSFRGRRINGARMIGLLALLANDLRSGCTTARLVDGLWPDRQPEHPTNAVQVLVSRARALLGTDTIANTPTGYRLALPDIAVDASLVRFSAHTGSRKSRAGDHVAALAHADTGLACWREPPTAQHGDDPLSALRAERALTYHALVRLRAVSLSRLGRCAEAMPILTALFAERPWDEELLLELLRCENATIGPSAAVVRYDEYRRSLRDELGTDPGPAVQALHRQLLEGKSPAVRYGVLQDPNPLLGRDDDVSAVSALLASSRATSIVGTGGLGKTRLAHAVCRQAGQRLVYFVPLAGVSRGVAAEVASVLESENVVNALDGRDALLVLDNCEHVIDEVSELVHAVVTRTEDVRVLTTSRAPLALSSEAVYRLPELDLSTAVELFTQRARAARQDVVLPGHAVDQLCRKLDGLPLAVELAAARVRVMSVQEIRDGLTDRFALLRGGARDTPSRHHTLEAVVEWSWQLLDTAGQTALLALSVFPGGFTAEAARFVLGSDDVLTRLVDQSLLKVLETPAGVRFRMLETVREFGASRRDPAATDAFLAWARQLGLAHFKSPFGADPYTAVGRIRAEQDNLLHAMRLGIAQDDGPTVAATAAVLAGLWTVELNYWRMSLLTKETAWSLSHYRPQPEYVDAVRSAAGWCVVHLFTVAGMPAGRMLYALRRLPVRDAGDSLILAMAKVAAVGPDHWKPDSAARRSVHDDPSPLVAGFVNVVASFIHRSANNPERALVSMRRAIDCFSADYPWMRGVVLMMAASLSIVSGRPARTSLRMALPVFEQLGAWSHVGLLRWAMVLASLRLDEVDEAEQWLALAALGQADDVSAEILPTPGVLAEIALARGETDVGLRQWRRAVDQLRATRGKLFVISHPGLEPTTLECEAVTVIAHAQHGRLDRVADIAEQLPDKLATLLANPPVVSSLHIIDVSLIGTLLVALAMTDTQHAPQLIALAERCHYLRSFQPTMASDRIRQWAEDIDEWPTPRRERSSPPCATAICGQPQRRCRRGTAPTITGRAGSRSR